MKISKKSWHYRLWMYHIHKSSRIFKLFLPSYVVWSEEPPKDLCSYVNSLFLAYFWYILLATVTIFASTVLFFCLIVVPIQQFLFYHWHSLEYDIFLGLSLFFWGATVISAGVFLLVQLIAHCSYAFVKRDKSTGISNLFKTYVSDRLNKICSFIEFED